MSPRSRIRSSSNIQRLISELGWLIVKSPQVFYTQGDYLSWINIGSRKRLDLRRKRDWAEVPFTWRVRDNEAGSTVCRFHEILRNWSPWNVSEHHDEALVRGDTYRQQSFLMTVSETCQYRILYTNVTPQWHPPVSREKGETKTYYFLSPYIYTWAGMHGEDYARIRWGSISRQVERGERSKLLRWYGEKY